jgi:hypothetical protein
MREVTLSGTFYEMGRQYGSRLAAQGQDQELPVHDSIDGGC